MNTQTQGYIRTKDGIRLYYSISGPADAPPLLFCYGLVCSKLNWKYQMEYFQDKYRVIYLDYRGHGSSATPTDLRSITIANLAADLAQFCEELALPPLCVLGHSLGVNVILEFYRLFPEKVSALVLCSGTPKDPFETMFNHNFLQILFPLLRVGNQIAPEILAQIWRHQGHNRLAQEFVARAGFNPERANRDDINEYLRVTSEVPFEVFLQLITDFTNYDACPWLDQVKIPTLIIGGEKDLVTPISTQRVMHSLIPKSQIKTYKDGSHNPQMEFTDEINKLIEKFLQGNGFARSEKPKTIKKSKRRSGRSRSAGTEQEKTT